MSLFDMTADGVDPDALAHPQTLFGALRDSGPFVEMPELGMVIVGREAEVREVLQHPDVYSSGFDAVSIGQVRPLIPLQIDPPQHKTFRKLLDPLFAPKQIALLEPQTRALVKELVGAVASDGGCNFHHAIAEVLPTTVFLQILGLPTSRLQEFLELKDGIIRPRAHTMEERVRMCNETGQKIYAVLQEVVDQRAAHREDDLISMFLDAEVDGHALTHEDVLDIGYLFFLAGLDTVTASLDCMLAYLAQHPEQRRRIVEDPAIIPHAVEEMLRWETPVSGIIRIAARDTELGGCPIVKGQHVSVLLGSANTDERAWERPDEIDFDREGNHHIAFGGGVHRCLGSHLARMELRVALEEWHLAVPDYEIAPGVDLLYSQGLRAIENLELAW
ncbi:MAG TPA: cytochrome P450 [Acidimicrobiales bacterium]|nr:cytochrome P450 [Acidimicrobiales bacterium]